MSNKIIDKYLFELDEDLVAQIKCSEKIKSDSFKRVYCKLHKDAKFKLLILSRKKHNKIRLQTNDDFQYDKDFNRPRRFSFLHLIIKNFVFREINSATIFYDSNTITFKLINFSSALNIYISWSHKILLIFINTKIAKRHKDIVKLKKTLGREPFHFYIRKILKIESNLPIGSGIELEIKKPKKSAEFLGLVKNVDLFDSWLITDYRNLYTYDSIYDSRADFISGLNTRLSISNIHNEKVTLFNTKARNRIEIDKCLVFSSRNTKNWFHFLIEDLPSLYYAHKELDISVPLLVPDFLQSQQLTAIKQLCSNRRFISISSDDLYTIRSCYIPIKLGVFHDSVLIPWNESKFYSNKKVREVFKRLKDSNLRELTEADFHLKNSRIFISRDYKNSKMRRTFVTRAADKYFDRYNFKTVNPGEFSLKEQILIFSTADFIIAPSGAALANLVFCNPGTTIKVLLNEEIVDFSVWKVLAKLNDLNIEYIAAKSLFEMFKNRDPYHVMHSDMLIDLEVAKKSIDELTS